MGKNYQMKIPESLIHTLIQFGCPIIKGTRWDEEQYEHVNYYGGCLNTSRDLALEAYEKLQSGIDYDKCHNYYDDSGSTFEGTDADSGTLSFMRCDIVTNTGETYRFAVQSKITDICRFVVNLTDSPPTFEKAMESLKNKLKSHNYQYYEFCIV
jgi:hypothetical protein